MANNNNLKTSISANIKANGNKEITGPVMQNALISIINHFGSGAVFGGIAIPSTNPGNPDVNTVYLATKPGTYTNFGGYVNSGGLVFFNNISGSWMASKDLDTKSVTGVVKHSSLGYIDTYRMSFSDGTYFDFTVTNGGDAKISNWTAGSYPKDSVFTLGSRIFRAKVNTSQSIGGSDWESIGGASGSGGLRGAMNESGDLATDFLQWETDKTLNAITGETQWGRDTDSVSPFKKVTGGASKIYIKARSTSSQYPTTIFGYDENKNPVGVILSGGAIDGKYVYPDLNVSFVRFAVNNYQNIPEIKLITLTDDINSIIDNREAQKNYATPAENAVYENGTEWAEKYGSQKTPVSKGDVVITNAKGVYVGAAKVAALSLYNNSGDWIGFVEEFNTVAYREYAYRRQYTVPEGVGFVKASFFGISNISDRYLYVERKGALTNGDVKRRVNDMYENSVFFKTFDDAVLSATDLTKSGNVYTKAAAGNVTITLPEYEQRVTSYLRLMIHVVKIKVTNVSGDIVISGKSGIKLGDIVQFSFTRGEYSLVYQDFHIKDFSFDKGCSFELLENKTFVIDKKTGYKLVNNSDVTDPVVTNWRVFYQFLQFGAEIDAGLFQEFSKGFEISTYSMQSRYSRFKQVSPAFKNGIYVAFGDSITADGDAHKTNYPHVVATELGMRLNNLAKSGSAPAQGTGWGWNLSDENLALVTPQTMLVTIAGGQNGWKTSTDIETRDRTTSIGAINFAIDYIYNVAPKAVIVLVGDPNGIGGNQADYQRIADNRKLPFVDIKNKIDWVGDVSRKVLRADDVHPTDLGVWRIAAVVLDTIRRYVL